MRCKACEYPLWNLTARTCPECGNDFAPSQFEFKPGTVQFRCPHCGQAHFGLGEGGHLVPPAFECAGCGKVIHEDQTVLIPAEGLEEVNTVVRRLPWIDRVSLGRLRALWQMIKLAMFSPGKLAQTLPDTPRPRTAWHYAAFATFVIACISLLPLILVYVVLGLFMGGGGITLFMIPGWLLLGVLAVVGTLMLCVVWALVTHLVLRLTGKTASGLARTFETMHYCAGCQGLNAIPCVGLYLGTVSLVWWAVSATIALTHAQKVSGTRAVLAVFTLPVIALVVLIPIVAFGLWSVSSAAPFAGRYTFPSTTSAARYDTTGYIASALREYALAGDGNSPKHVALLLAQHRLSPDMLMAPGSKSTPPTTQASGAVLVVYDHGDSAFKSNTAALAVMVLGERVIAYRVGDFVFCDQGIDFKTADPKLWALVRSFDPAQNPAPDAEFKVGLLDGSVVRFATPEEFEAALAEQNALRATHGLKPLPDPGTITNPSPAR